MATSTPSAVIDIGGQAQQKGLNFANTYSPGDYTSGFGAFISLVLRGVLVVGLLAVLIFLVWGAIEWIVSAGDKGKVEKAREKITGSIIGLIVLASTVALFALLQDFFGVHVFSFNGQ